jgi:hypothetical protein
MDSTFALIVTMAVAMNPANVTRVAQWIRPAGDRWVRWVAMVVGAAAAVLVLLAVISGPLLDLLDVSGPTFRLGAAIVIGLAGARSMIWPGPPIGSGEALSPQQHAVLLGFVGLVIPGTAFMAVGGGAVHGVGPAVLAIVVAAALSALALVTVNSGSRLADLTSRFIGAGAVIVAIAVGIDAARTV